MGGVSELLLEAIEAHGGMKHWNPVTRVLVSARVTGIALTSKLRPFPFKSMRAEVTPRIPRVVFESFPGDGQRGIFEREGVRIVGPDGDVRKERENPREEFRGIHRSLYWDDLDVLYFGGYALWNYINLPFLLYSSGFTVREGDPWEEGGKTYRRLHATFPEDIPTHSREQVFYLNAGGLIERHDYTAEVFGKWARAVNYSSEFTEAGGLVIPTRRIVFPRRSSGHPGKAITLVFIRIEEVSVRRD